MEWPWLADACRKIFLDGGDIRDELKVIGEVFIFPMLLIFDRQYGIREFPPIGSGARHILSAFDPHRLQVAFGGKGIYDFSWSRHKIRGFEIAFYRLVH